MTAKTRVHTHAPAPTVQYYLYFATRMPMMMASTINTTAEIISVICQLQGQRFQTLSRCSRFHA